MADERRTDRPDRPLPSPAARMAAEGSRGTDRAQPGIDLSVRARPHRGMPVGTVRKIVGGLDAELVLFIRWRGGDLDRLLDAGHARLCDDLARLLTNRGWEVAPEVSYSEYGERGSIDVLGFHPESGLLLVTEVKTEVASVEETF